MVAAVAVAAAAGGAQACGGADAEEEPSGGVERARVEQRPWGRAVPGGGRTVRVHYLSNPAWSLDRVRVRESNDAVELTLFERAPRAPATLEGVLTCVQVRLQQPLGSRSVRDGAGRSKAAERALPPGKPAKCPPAPRVVTG